MSFLHKYNGTADPRLLHLERLTWLLIYGGCIAFFLGYFLQQGQGQDAGPVYWGATLSVALGLLLIFQRSRMTERV